MVRIKKASIMTTETTIGGEFLSEHPDKILENDPMEAIFALNLGDFVTEHLISDDLLGKINTSVQDKVSGLKNQLKELISIYSLDNTLTLLGFSSEEDFIIYNSIAKTISQMLEIDACHIFLTTEYAKTLDKENKFDLILAGSSKTVSKEVKSSIGCNLKDEQNPLTQSFMMGESIYKTDISTTSVLNNGEIIKTLLTIPMVSNSGEVGVISLECTDNREILPEFIALLEITARLFVTSMNLQRLIEDTQNLLDNPNPTPMELRHLRTELTAVIGDLGDEQQMFVEAMASAVDAKGHYVKEHSTKVAKLARRIAEYLHLNEKTTDLIYYAGLLQNIGKITLPEELFNKKEKLSKEDWEKLENHPNVGVNLLMKINFLSEVIPYIHYHRERWNGKGEPEGLSGNSIPLGSRIIAVADAYQAMVAERPYRRPISNDKALEIIKSESGEKWDPIIVDALVEIRT